MAKFIFLAGGGSPEQANTIDDKWLSLVRSRANGKEVMYVPHAQGQEKRESAYKWFLNTYAARLGSIGIRLWSEGQEFSSNLFASIYIGGGRTDRLMECLKNSNSLSSLKAYVADGGIYYGGSAGAIILGKTILTAPEVSRDYEPHAGLGLLGRYSVACHYGTPESLSTEEALRISQTYDTDVMMVPEESGVITDGNTINVVGQFPVAVQGRQELLLAGKSSKRNL